jgi:hypothetical protein
VHTTDSAVSEPPASTAWRSLSHLAAILQEVHGLRAAVAPGADGAPELCVTGQTGTATILAGSVHYWRSPGEGPIGPVNQAGLVARRVAGQLHAAARVKEPGS